MVFNPSIIREDDLSKIFRIFTDPNTKCHEPRYRATRRNPDLEQQVTVYTDRSWLDNREENARTGSRIWFGREDLRNMSLQIAHETGSNQVGELAVVLYATKMTHPFALLKIISNSRYTIEGITENSHKWEDKGYIGVENKDLFKAIIGTL